MSLSPNVKRSIYILVLVFSLSVEPVLANNTSASLPFTQDWSNAGLITTSDDWSSVPAIIGYRGDNLTAVNGVDPQTVLTGDDAAPVVDVIANVTNPNTNTTGGVAEFETPANPTIALQGSGTADAPYIKIFLNTTDKNNVRISFDARDIDGSTDDAIQPVALQYRIGSSGNFTNVPAGFIADATTGPSLATLVTSRDVLLPTAIDDQAWVELRIITTNAASNDEWVGIDDISITANSAPTDVSLTQNSVMENSPANTAVGTLTAADPDTGDTHSFTLVNDPACAGSGADNVNFNLIGNAISTTVSFDFETRPSYAVCVQVADNNGLSFIGEVAVTIQDIADETPPQVLFSSNTTPANNSILLTGPKQITVEFNEDVKHDAGAGAANTIANYLLVEAGANGSFDTATCLGGRVSDDVNIVINSASYSNSGGHFVSTLDINNGTALGAGSYRLFVCGTTSIEDLQGNELNNGASDAQLNFTVSSILNPSNDISNSDVLLPVTGFPKGQVTPLPAQPSDKRYASSPDLWLEIPSLSVSTPIVGVPLSADGWDVTWLGNDAGWLNGTAFPTWDGNSVITGHVWDAYDQPGVFANLKALKYGDLIKVHAFGQIYIYEVRQTKRIAPGNVSAALAHEEKAWLTLLTCEDYKFLFQTYQSRRMVRAVLVSVVSEK